ncbi:MAG: hypothetical protein KC613_19980, partial [Myxococcales bacterium]|nr:hypothetical protein [Myxococcales bacterium]
MRWLALWTVVVSGAALLGAGPARARDEATVRGLLADALALYRNARAEQTLMTVDPNERALLVGPVFFEGVETAEDFEVVFLTGDEAFERELDRGSGLGQGEAWGPWPAPARVRRVHDGDRGGLDASSCRSCHFSGGTDGGGTLTQVGLFRGDGRRLSAATVRDAPHIMGSGYLQRLAREIEADLADQVRVAVEGAPFNDGALAVTLRAKGLRFGEVVVFPDGTLDLSGVAGVGQDLVVRPFGWKGRHADLVALSDEALQVHLGVQTDSRVADFAHDPQTWLGDGPAWDPDGDGVSFEANAGQAMLLGAYMSQLGTPRFEPAEDPRLGLLQARGRALFEAVGCAACHVPELRVTDTRTVLRSTGADPFEYAFDLAQVGQQPRPLRVDPGEGPDGEVPAGVPVFAFTDLR